MWKREDDRKNTNQAQKLDQVVVENSYLDFGVARTMRTLYMVLFFVLLFFIWIHGLFIFLILVLFASMHFH